MSKKTAYVVANCQVRALEAALSISEKFSSRFKFVSIPPVHVIKPEDVLKLHDSLPSTDLLLAQFVSEGYRNNIGLGLETLRKLMPPNGITISWPSIYWPGYNPELFYFKNQKGSSFTEVFDYHHRVIFEGYCKGLSPETVTNNFFDPESFVTSKNEAETALINLSKRELNLDVKTASFIRDKYQSERLFYTFNHPSQSVILHVARQVLKMLDIPDDLPQKAPKELLNSTIYPILPSVISALDLKFENREEVIVRNNKLSVLDTVRSYFSLYEKNPSLVQLNSATLGTT